MRSIKTIIPFIFLAAACTPQVAPEPEPAPAPFKLEVYHTDGVLEDGELIKEPAFRFKLTEQVSLWNVDYTINGIPGSRSELKPDIEHLIPLPEDATFGSYILSIRAQSFKDKSVVEKKDTLYIKGRPIESITGVYGDDEIPMAGEAVQVYPKQKIPVKISFAPAKTALEYKLTANGGMTILGETEGTCRGTLSFVLQADTPGESSFTATFRNGNEEYKFSQAFSILDEPMPFAFSVKVEDRQQGDEATVIIDSFSGLDAECYNISIMLDSDEIYHSESPESVTSGWKHSFSTEGMSIGEHSVSVSIKDEKVNINHEITFMVNIVPLKGLKLKISKPGDIIWQPGAVNHLTTDQVAKVVNLTLIPEPANATIESISMDATDNLAIDEPVDGVYKMTVNNSHAGEARLTVKIQNGKFMEFPFYLWIIKTITVSGRLSGDGILSMWSYTDDDSIIGEPIKFKAVMNIHGECKYAVPGPQTNHENQTQTDMDFYTSVPGLAQTTISSTYLNPEIVDVVDATWNYKYIAQQRHSSEMWVNEYGLWKTIEFYVQYHPVFDGATVDVGTPESIDRKFYRIICPISQITVAE